MPRAGLSTAAVVDMAVRVVDDFGLDALTLAAVAGRFGVAPPSLYKHVDGLRALGAAVAVRATTELADALADAVGGHSGQEALRALATAYREYARSYPQRYAATQRAPEPGDQAHLAAATRAVRAVEAALRGYGLAGDDAVHAIRVVRSGLHGFTSLEGGDGFGMPQNIETTFARLVDALDLVLRTWTAEERES